MENYKKNCSQQKHLDKAAIVYCKNCSLYMCPKCESHHSELFNDHNLISLDNIGDELFNNNCKEKNHSYPITHFCKAYKTLCCALCIS